MKPRDKNMIRRVALAAACLIFILTVIWNIWEIYMVHTPIQCDQLTHMTIGQFWIHIGESDNRFGEIFHFLYHAIENSSFTDATYLLPLFALAIAMVQVIFPYRHSKVCGYPVYKLEENMVTGKFHYCLIVVWTITALVSDLLKLYILQYVSALYSCGLMLHMIVKNLSWYQKAEKVPIFLGHKFREDLENVLRSCQKAQDQAIGSLDPQTGLYKDTISEIESSMEIIESLSFASRSDLEARLALEDILTILSKESAITVLEKPADNLEDIEQRIGFTYACYITRNILKENISEYPVADSWYFKLLQRTLDQTNFAAPMGEAVISGILCGMLMSPSRDLYTIIGDHTLKQLQGRLQNNQFADVLRVICAFSELYFRMNNKGLYDSDALFQKKYFMQWDWTNKINIYSNICERYYNYWMEMGILDGTEPFSVVELALSEINETDWRKKFPKTVLGKVKYILRGNL